MDGSAPPNITELLERWGNGNQEALMAVVPGLYKHLHVIAHAHLRNARPGHTLQTTALVNEAYLRLHQKRFGRFQNRAHFIAICALMMRQILVDHERTRRAAKRGDGIQPLNLEDVNPGTKRKPLDVLALNDALEVLVRLDPQQGRIVELRFFGGLSIEETAEALAISPATVKRAWSTARLWLYRQLRPENT